jgi:hypothetical protein
MPLESKPLEVHLTCTLDRPGLEEEGPEAAASFELPEVAGCRTARQLEAESLA